MAFKLSNFWRWKSALSTDYNGLVAAIAAWRPDEVADHAVLARHLSKPPSYMLTDYNDAPAGVASGQPACSVLFTASAASGPRLVAKGFWWPHGPDPNLGPEVDYEFKITTRPSGGAWDHSYQGDKYPDTHYGHTTGSVGGFDPHGGQSGQPILWYGGDKLQMTNHVINTHDTNDAEIGLFVPQMPGTAFLFVVAEDNG